MTSHTFLPAGAPLVVPSPSTEGDWQLADDCSTRRTYTVAARVCEWLTWLCVPACLKILGAVAEEPENIITSRRFTKPEGGTLTHPSIYTDGLTGNRVVDFLLFAETAWDRHRTVANSDSCKSLQCQPHKILLLVARGIWSCHPSARKRRNISGNIKESVVKTEPVICEICACCVWWCHASDTHFYRFKISLFVANKNPSLEWSVFSHPVPVVCVEEVLKCCVLCGWVL